MLLLIASDIDMDMEMMMGMEMGMEMEKIYLVVFGEVVLRVRIFEMLRMIAI